MTIDLDSVIAWAKQPSTVTGISALAAAAAGVASGQMSLGTAVPAVVFGVVAVLLPDNSAAWDDATRLAKDALGLAAAGAKGGQAAPVVADIAALANDAGHPAKPAAKA